MKASLKMINFMEPEVINGKTEKYIQVTGNKECSMAKEKLFMKTFKALECGTMAQKYKIL